MVTIEVKLSNDFDTKYETIELTKEELYQMACNKAKGMYMEGFYTNIQAVDDYIKTQL